MVGAIIGGIIVPTYFDAFIIVASAITGAAMVLAGAHWLFPGVGLLDRVPPGGFPPRSEAVHFERDGHEAKCTPIWRGSAIAGTVFVRFVPIVDGCERKR